MTMKDTATVFRARREYAPLFYFHLLCLILLPIRIVSRLEAISLFALINYFYCFLLRAEAYMYRKWNRK